MLLQQNPKFSAQKKGLYLEKWFLVLKVLQPVKVQLGPQCLELSCNETLI